MQYLFTLHLETRLSSPIALVTYPGAYLTLLHNQPFKEHQT